MIKAFLFVDAVMIGTLCGIACYRMEAPLSDSIVLGLTIFSVLLGMATIHIQES